MLSKKVQSALNEQIQMELSSAYAYLAMAAYFEEANFGGFAKWMKVQAQEELGHAMKFFDHIQSMSGSVELGAVAKPARNWKSPLAAFETALGHEERVTKAIYSLVDLAAKERDHATDVFLNWFVTEQVEEEKTANDAVLKLRLAGDSSAALLMLDREFGSRTV